MSQHEQSRSVEQRPTRSAFFIATVLAACLLLGTPIPGRAQRGSSGSHGGNSRAAETTTTDDTDVIAQLDEALRLVRALKTQSAELRAQVAAARADRERAFQAISSAQAGMEENLQSIIRIGRELLARAAR